MTTANASSYSNAAEELQNPLSPPPPPRAGRAPFGYNDGSMLICCDGTRFPRAPALATAEPPMEYLAKLTLYDDTSDSSDDFPSCTFLPPMRQLPPVAKRHEAPPSMDTTSSSPASADQPTGGACKLRKKPELVGLAINTNIDDHEVDVRFVKAIRSRRLNQNEPVFGTVEYHRAQLRALATPIYWNDYDRMQGPVRYVPMRRHGKLMHFYAPPPHLVLARRAYPGRRGSHQCLPLDWLTKTFKRVRNRVARALE